jgi:ribose transport system permease protein
MKTKSTEANAGDLEKKPGRSVPELAALSIFLIALIVYFSFATEYFLGVENWINILSAVSVAGIIAVPGTMLLIAAQVDLSVGSAAAFTGTIAGIWINSSGVGLGIFYAIVIGVVIGVVNGWLITKVQVNALITTLGTLAILRGLSYIVGGGQTLMVPKLSYLGLLRPFFNLPLAVVVFVVICIAGVFVMKYTTFGRSLYVIGANPAAARLVGIRTPRVILICFVLSGVSTAFAGLILTSQLTAASPMAANGLELSVITAIVLGGASLNGGRGTISGTILGLLIIGVLNNGLVLLNVDTFWQQVARGTLLIIAVSFDQLRERWGIKRG